MSEGRIDFHLHIVPGVDDGSRNAEDTIEMARILLDFGYTRALNTSHIHPQLWSNRDTVLTGLANAQQIVNDAGLSLELIPAAEHYFDETLFDLIESGGLIPINGTRYFLVEFPKSEVPANILQMVFMVQRKGFVPIIAHPERYGRVQDDIGFCDEFIRMGCPLQLDLGSIAGEYGWAAKRAAKKMLARGMFNLVGTDMHRPKGAAAYLKKAYRRLTSAVGEAMVHDLSVVNPGRVLNDDDVLWFS